MTEPLLFLDLPFLESPVEEQDGWFLLIFIKKNNYYYILLLMEQKSKTYSKKIEFVIKTEEVREYFRRMVFRDEEHGGDGLTR